MRKRETELMKMKKNLLVLFEIEITSRMKYAIIKQHIHQIIVYIPSS
jgi:hypothetical protein